MSGLYERMRTRALRLCYRVLYRLAEAGISEGSNIIYGFSRKFRAPGEVADKDLYYEIHRLADAIKGAS